MIDVFTTSKYDNKIAVTNGEQNFTFAELKKLIIAEANYLKDKKDNLVILNHDNFDFIIQFFAALICSKNIFLVTDKNKLNSLKFDYDLLEGYIKEPLKTTQAKIDIDIDIFKPLINFYTSGSSSEPKVITKSLHNLICEAKDLGIELNLNDKSLTVMSTTTMCHRFGLTFHLIIPIIYGLIINTQNVSYPENIDKENIVLISTPTFLSAIPKFKIPFKINPQYIISAGSKLHNDVFKFLEQKSKVIDIYGSTETGVIAFRNNYNEDFKILNNVKLDVHENYIEVFSDYIFKKKDIINDCVELKNNQYIKFKNRTDRIFKIYEKRINADELSEDLKTNKFVKDCFITKNNEKLVCLCALSEDGKNYLLKNDISKLIKSLKIYLYQYSEIIPQKWKFIDELPMMQAGKINKKLIEHLFNINLSLPIILDRTIEEDSITYKVFFYHQCNFFKGHFPDFKLVPGVLQLYLAKELTNMHYNLSFGQGQWKRIKFSNIIKPDSIVNLKLEYSKTHVTYEYFDEAKKYASGVFLCENIFKGEL